MNQFHQAAVDKMSLQINYLQELLGRKLTAAEKDNLHEFFNELDLEIQFAFEDKVGALL